MAKIKKEIWKHSYGDGEATDDLVLWKGKKPTNICISGWVGCWSLMIGSYERYLGSTIKECKEFYNNEVSKEA